jgi:RecB family endonuclease NucS
MVLPFKILELPDFDTAKHIIENERKNMVINIFGLCAVFYDGRASSIATYSQRLITIKPDGTVFIHNNKKMKPVNWQPSGSIVEVDINDELVISVIRRRPREVLKIKIPIIYYITLSLLEEGEFHLYGSEAEMVKEVMENPLLIEKDFVPLSREYATPYGKIDLLGKTSKGLLVLEFKRAQAGLDAVSQVKRYVDFMRESYNNVRGGIVAPAISKNAYNLLMKYDLEYFNFPLNYRKLIMQKLNI